MTDYDSLWDETVACRKWLEDEKGRSTIDGNCHNNAIWFADYLTENTNLTPYIRWGAVDYYNKNYPTRMDAEDDGAIHFWIEVELDSGWAMADVFTMRSDSDQLSRGEATIRPDLPESYTTFPETLYEYSPEITAGLLIGPEMSYLQNKVDPEPPNIFEKN